MADVIAAGDPADDVTANGGAAVLAYIRALAEHGAEVRDVARVPGSEGDGHVAFALELAGGWSLALRFAGVPLERLRNGDDNGEPVEISVNGNGHPGWNAAVKAGLDKVAARRREHPTAAPDATAPRGGTGSAGVWRVPDVIGSLDINEDVDVNGGETLIAYMAELAERGVLAHDVEREIDAEGAGMLAFLLDLDGGGELYVHVPGVPPAWLRDPSAFHDEWAAWDDEGYICEIFIQHEGYLTWEDAVEAGVAAARGATGER
ncbi:hypothetical protein ACFO4E_04605 [Nocardiopsis mangrovi]|uniref:Uncharacterized protein n=1 Tax=Nocardiopsis mangrovi TaxID=1179818 RepID=A0ABV9DQF2_9ACTN